ncbi:hypothetical protein PT974_11148 [Cladobotryum mycophilum]|uniref:Uncharacterized protein n=1 Tax=Cladobotryum mycophilum TaxID=491253 RepID=A0ABR0S5C2_9HYPO
MDVDDAHISVRFKHGIHTIFIFIDSLAPFSSVTEELLELVRERYPDGLTKSASSPETTPIPESANVVYGVLAVQNDASKGWKKLKVGERGENTPTRCGLKNNSIVAFTFVEDEDEDDVEFEVEWPQEDEEMYEQAA